MKKIIVLGLLVGFHVLFEPTGAQTPLYRDASQPVETRIDDLLRRMILAEKVGQMNMPCVYEGGLGHSIEEKMQAVKNFAEGTFKALDRGVDFSPCRIRFYTRVPFNKLLLITSYKRLPLKKPGWAFPC